MSEDLFWSVLCLAFFFFIYSFYILKYLFFPMSFSPGPSIFANLKVFKENSMKDAINHEVRVFSDLHHLNLSLRFSTPYCLPFFWQTLCLEPWEWVMDLPWESPGLIAMCTTVVVCQPHQLATQSGKYFLATVLLSYICGSFCSLWHFIGSLRIQVEGLKLHWLSSYKYQLPEQRTQVLFPAPPW